ncbi:Phosphoglycerate dehydrogenase [Sporobacter termitidis DSM 10068]|uniref:Phosphoglycerate dehydrogenase n=1 Tax=Sporobacter termitidis DSM 10068 TaxID=1123282 RepID=A0A1M5XNM7_9FIRM|nr:D-2-hydroxyacid dehydrogenase [Sporobacter termitidis]SHI01420.1 Phosphoglycerate dehydrogenase [Sporobacter termitidis DSM 10068]
MIVSLLVWDTPYLEAIEEATGEKVVECRSAEAALKALPEADIALTMGGAALLDETLLATAKKLRLVLSASAGVEKLPLEALHARDIAVCNAKGAHAVTIAEYVLGGMLAWSHHFPTFIQHQERAHWQSFFSGDDLDGQTLLVVGTGLIGREIGRKAGAFDMRVLGLRRHPAPEPHFDEILGIGALRETLPRADFVVMATPLTDETYHLMGAEEFRAMKDSAVFINIARGDTVDEDALISALRGRQIAGAVLDVFHREPLPKDSPLWSMDNVMITPHNAGLSDSAERKTIRFLCDNIRRFRAGQPLINQIKKGEAY